MQKKSESEDKLKTDKVYLILFLILMLITFLSGRSIPSSITPEEPVYKPNLDIIYELADSSITILNADIESRVSGYYVKLNLAPAFNVLEGRIKSKLSPVIREYFQEIVYSIENIKVEYPEVFRDGLFGDYKVTRKFTYSGYYSMKEEVRKFELTKSDTIDYEQISLMEYPSLAFTVGEKPAVPFFSSIIQPVIVIGAIAVTTYLFFSVRSK